LYGCESWSLTLREEHRLRVLLLLLLLLLLFTAIGFSPGGSSPYTSSDETMKITQHNKNKNYKTKISTHKTKHSKYKYNTHYKAHTEYRVLREIFGRKRDEVTGEWR
jgi:hypothetical protein